MDDENKTNALNVNELKTYNDNRTSVKRTHELHEGNGENKKDFGHLETLTDYKSRTIDTYIEEKSPEGGYLPGYDVTAVINHMEDKAAGSKKLNWILGGVVGALLLTTSGLGYRLYDSADGNLKDSLATSEELRIENANLQDRLNSLLSQEVIGYTPVGELTAKFEDDNLIIDGASSQPLRVETQFYNQITNPNGGQIEVSSYPDLEIKLLKSNISEPNVTSSIDQEGLVTILYNPQREGFGEETWVLSPKDCNFVDDKKSISDYIRRMDGAISGGYEFNPSELRIFGEIINNSGECLIDYKFKNFK